MTLGATGSEEGSAQSAGKRKPTVSEGAILAMDATTVVDGCGERPARTLNPAAKPPTPAPPIMARHTITLVLIPLDRLDRLDGPPMFPQPVFPDGASSSLQTKRNYGCPGTFLRPFLLVPEGVSTPLRSNSRTTAPRTRCAPLPNQTTLAGFGRF